MNMNLIDQQWSHYNYNNQIGYVQINHNPLSPTNEPNEFEQLSIHFDRQSTASLQHSESEYESQGIISIADRQSDSIDQNQNSLDEERKTQSNLKTNNVVKNILKQFYKYLTRKSNSSLITDFIIEKPLPYSIKLIKKYFERISYNNLSLIKIIKHEKYGKGFEYFLTFDAVDELMASKVKNLEKHLSCISYLKECCASPSQINDINFYKKGKFYF